MKTTEQRHRELAALLVGEEPQPEHVKLGARELHNLMESVRIEDERLQAIAAELGLPKPTDRAGYEGRHTAFSIIASLRQRVGEEPASDQKIDGAVQLTAAEARNIAFLLARAIREDASASDGDRREARKLLDKLGGDTQ